MSEITDALDVAETSAEPPQDPPAEQLQTEAPEQPAEQPAEQAAEQEQSADERAKHGLLAELRSERQARRQAQEAYEQLAQKYQTVDERLNKINERISPPPDKDEDPLGYLTQQQQELQGQVNTVVGHMEMAETRSKASAFRAHVEGLEAQFKAKAQDYDNAIGFLKSQRLKDYEALGIHDPAQAEQAFNSEVAWVINNSVYAGRNPAAVAYEMAKNRGWKPNGTGNGAAASQQRRLKDIAAQATASQPPQRPAGDSLTPEDLAEMSEEEAHEAIDKMGEREWKRLWTGAR